MLGPGDRAVCNCVDTKLKYLPGQTDKELLIVVKVYLLYMWQSCHLIISLLWLIEVM